MSILCLQLVALKQHFILVGNIFYEALKLIDNAL